MPHRVQRSIETGPEGAITMIAWGRVLVGQLEFYWDVHLRPRLEGLTDSEYCWEPVEGCWTLRRQKGGTWVLDEKWPEPSPLPVTTIAWRLVHVAVGCFATRASAFFDASAPEDAAMFDPRIVPVNLPGTAGEAIAFSRCLCAIFIERPKRSDWRPADYAGWATVSASATSTVSAGASCRRERKRKGRASPEMPAPIKYDGA
jgi:hypothetical protein